MQLFVRCGVPFGTITVDCALSDTVNDLKDRLSAKIAQLGPCRFMRLQHAGVSLLDERRLGDVCGLHPHATLQLGYRLRGGGGDGGSTGAESRSCYLEMYLGRKADKVNPEEERLAKWTRCHLSGELLSPPCVVDDLGNLYNKDVLIQRLLDKNLPPALAHLTGLKSVTKLELHATKRETAGKAVASSQVSFQPSNNSDFCCPISGVAFNGRYKFLVLRPSGHVVSEKAFKEVPAVVEELAGRKVSELETIPVNPTGEQLEQLRARLASRLVEKGASKKDKKRSAAAATAAASTAMTSGASSAVASAETSAGGQRCASPPANDTGAAGAAKRLKIPTGGTKDVYASIFSSSRPEGSFEKETYCCRSLSARGMNLT